MSKAGLARRVQAAALAAVLAATLSIFFSSRRPHTSYIGDWSSDVCSSDLTPPVGGPHAPQFQDCGFYDAPIVTENAVHSLERGAVWITYRPDLPPGELDALRRLARRERLVLVSPYPELPVPVVASAWGRQLRLHSADDSRLGRFVRIFQNGLQAPERGRECSGGIGTPR